MGVPGARSAKSVKEVDVLPGLSFLLRRASACDASPRAPDVGPRPGPRPGRPARGRAPPPRGRRRSAARGACRAATEEVGSERLGRGGNARAGNVFAGSVATAACRWARLGGALLLARLAPPVSGGAAAVRSGGGDGDDGGDCLLSTPEARWLERRQGRGGMPEG